MSLVSSSAERGILRDLIVPNVKKKKKRMVRVGYRNSLSRGKKAEASLQRVHSTGRRGWSRGEGGKNLKDPARTINLDPIGVYRLENGV